MKIHLNYINQITVLLIICLALFSCSKENENIENLNTTIYIRHKNADMPAFIHGNASEKVFLIMLHGGPGGLGLQYRANTIKSKIEKKCAVVYFDQRGCGNAQGSYAEADLSVNLMAEDVLALVKVLKAKYGNNSQFFLMGHSWGGTLGPAVLLKNQDVFSGWINVDGAHSPKDLYKKYKKVLHQEAELQIDHGNSVDHWQKVIELVNEVADEYNTDDFFKLNQRAHNSENVLALDKVIYETEYNSEEVSKYNPIKVSLTGNKTVMLLADKGLYKTVSYTNQLHQITIPSLVLWGKNDLIVPTEFAQEAYDNLGSTDKELVIFEHSGHSPMFSEPKLFAEKVIEFIEEFK